MRRKVGESKFTIWRKTGPNVTWKRKGLEKALPSSKDRLQPNKISENLTLPSVTSSQNFLIIRGTHIIKLGKPDLNPIGGGSKTDFFRS